MTLRWPRLVPRFAVILLVVSPLASTSSYADLADDVLACERIDFGNCPALLKAAAAKADVLKKLAALVRAPTTAAATRIKAAEALSMLDAREEKDALQDGAKALANLPGEVDLLAAQARLGDPRAIDGLMRSLKSSDQRTKVLAAGSLGILKHKGAVPLLIELVAAQSPGRIQAAAAHALGLIADPTAESALIALVAEAQAYVPARVAGLDALAALGSEKAFVLATLLIDVPARDVGRAALRLLATAPSVWIEPAIMYAMATPGLRGEAAKIIASMQIAALGPLVVQTAQQPDLDQDEKLWVYTALGKLHPQGAAAVLMARLPNAPQDEQILILKTLPGVGDRTVIPDLIALLHNSNKELVNYAVYSLERLTGQNLGSDQEAWRHYAGLETRPVVKRD